MFDITKTLNEMKKAIELADLYIQRRYIIFDKYLNQDTSELNLTKKEWLAILQKLNDENKLDIKFQNVRYELERSSNNREQWDLKKLLLYIRNHDAIQLETTAYFGTDEFDGSIHNEEEYVAIYGYTESDWHRGTDSREEMIYLNKEWLNCLANEGVEAFDAVYDSYVKALTEEIKTSATIVIQQKTTQHEKEIKEKAEEQLAKEKVLFEELKLKFEPTTEK